MHVFFSAAVSVHCFPTAVLMMDDDLLIPGPDMAFAFRTWKVSTML